MASLEELQFVSNTAQNIGNQAKASQLDARKQEVVKQAGMLFQGGDVQGAITALAEINPDVLNSPLAEQFKMSITPEENMIVEGKDDQFLVGKQSGDKKALGVGVKTPANSRGGVFQARDPLTGEVLLLDRATGAVVDILGSPTAPRRDQKSLEKSGGMKEGALVAGTMSEPLSAESEIIEPTPKELFQSLNAKERDFYDKLTKEYRKTVEDDVSAIQAAQNIGVLLDQGGEIKQDVLRAIQTQFARASGEKGAMTEQDVAPYGGRQSILNRLERAIQFAAKGKLPEGDRKFLTQLAGTLAEASQRSIMAKGAPLAAQIATRTRLKDEEAGGLLLQEFDFINKPKSALEAIDRLGRLPSGQRKKYFSRLPADIKEKVKKKLGASNGK